VLSNIVRVYSVNTVTSLASILIYEIYINHVSREKINLMEQTPITAEVDGPLVLFGGGRMGAGDAAGWIEAGISARGITVIDPSPSAELIAFAGHAGFCRSTAGFTPEPAQTIVLAVKPQKSSMLAETLASIAAGDTLLISIMAGKTVADLGKTMPGINAFVRSMPNLPAAVGRGATVLLPGRDVPPRICGMRCVC